MTVVLTHLFKLLSFFSLIKLMYDVWCIHRHQRHIAEGAVVSLQKHGDGCWHYDYSLVLFRKIYTVYNTHPFLRRAFLGQNCAYYTQDFTVP